MAIELHKQTQINVGALISNSITAVKAVQTQEQSRKESLFQQAVSSGMTYAAQVKFRQKQLDELKGQSFVSEEYRQKLTDSIAATKKLSRFQKYRTKYSESLAELNAGSINEEDYLKTLKSILRQTDDADLRTEIQGNITIAEGKLTTYKNTLLSNQVKRAKYDGTEKILNSAIDEVREARAVASIAGNDAAVEEYDLTISSLNSQKVQVRAENVVNDLAVAGSVSNFNAKSKLDKLGSQIEDADFDEPITIGGRRFNSEREYWEVTRSAYLSGNGSGIFADYFSEIESQYKTKIDSDVARFGFVTDGAITEIQNDFIKLKQNPDFAPFLTQIDSMQALVVGAAVDTMASVVVDRAQYTGDFNTADATLKNLGSRYNVDTTGRQLSLATVLNTQINASIAAGGGTPPEASLFPSSEFPVPSAAPGAPAPSTTFTPSPAGTPAPTPTPQFVPTPTAPAPPTPTPTGAPASTQNSFHRVTSGDTLGAIASRNNTTVERLVELNPQYKENPDLINIDDEIKLEGESTQTPTPVDPMTIKRNL